MSDADDFGSRYRSLTSAEFHRWLERVATPEMLREVTDRYPEHKRAVAGLRETPLGQLAELRHDVDEGVQWAVRTNSRWLADHPEDAKPWLDDPARLVHFGLDERERSFLARGVVEWGGPARCTDELAVAMGFEDVRDLFVTGGRIHDDLRAGRPLSRTDWTRALAATEIVFASDVFGSPVDWPYTSGFDDATSLAILRSLQRKIRTGGVVGTVFGRRPTAP